MTPTWSIKKGTRYRYYVSTALEGGKTGRSNRLRIPAGNLETIVVNRLRNFLADRSELLDAIGNEFKRKAGLGILMERAQQLSIEIASQDPERVRTIASALVCHIEICSDHIKINVARPKLASLLSSSSIDRAAETLLPDDDSNSVIALTVPASLQRLGREMKLLIDDSNKTVQIDASMVRLIARAHDLQSRLNADTTITVHDIADQERIGAPYTYLLRLA